MGRAQFIVPYDEYKLRSENNDRHVDEEYDLIGKPHVPTDTEKQQVHEQVVELLTAPDSQQFLMQAINTSGERYEVYPQKFLGATWDELGHLQLASEEGSTGYSPSVGFFQDYVINNGLGLLLMHYLAQACAGSTRRLITDRTAAYNSLNQALAASVVENATAPIELERVVTRSVTIVDPSCISLEKLTALRRAEAGAQGHHLRKMRHKYLEMIDRFAARLNNAAEVNVAEIERQQEQEMKDNLAELKYALKVTATDALHEKEIFIAMVAFAGMAVTPIAIPAGITSIIALNKTRLKHKEARRNAMTDHAMSWLLQASQHGRITAY